MRALVGTGLGVSVEQVKDPSPRPDGVVVEVVACGVCGSDVRLAVEGRVAEGHILGHEFSGRVADVGRDVDRRWIGKTVAVNPMCSCGACRACQCGIPLRCQQEPNVGLSAPGAFAEYVSVPEKQLVELPRGELAELGALAEPLAVAMMAVDQARVHAGDAVAVCGVGPIGLCTVVALRLLGVDAIVATGRRSASRRAAAGRVGAGVVLDTRDRSIGEYAMSTGLEFAAVIDCAGAEGGVAEALDLLQPGGVVVEVALTDSNPCLSLRRLVMLGASVIGSCAYDAPTYDRAVGHVASGVVDLDQLISDRVDLDGALRALTQPDSSGDSVMVLCQPGRVRASGPTERGCASSEGVDPPLSL